MAKITKAQARKRLLEADAKAKKVFTNTHFMSFNTYKALSDAIKKAIKEIERY